MKKTAVIFPGMGYTKDRPLLYYTGKLAREKGYDLVHIDYPKIEWSKEKLKDGAFLLKTLEECLVSTDDQMKTLSDISSHEVLFISKSIGTVVAAAYDSKNGINGRHIWFSPLEMIDSYVRDESGILFYGDDDPFADYKKIELIARDKKLETYRIQGGNHSLETGDVLRDIRNCAGIMERVEEML